MAKQEPLEMPGVVSEVLPNTLYRVTLEDDREIIADLSQKMRQDPVQVAAGDRVMVEMTRYDLTRGRITLRVL